MKTTKASKAKKTAKKGAAKAVRKSTAKPAKKTTARKTKSASVKVSPKAKRVVGPDPELLDSVRGALKKTPWQKGAELLASVNKGRKRSVSGAKLTAAIRYLRGLNGRGEVVRTAELQIAGRRSGTRYALASETSAPPERFPGT